MISNCISQSSFPKEIGIQLPWRERKGNKLSINFAKIHSRTLKTTRSAAVEICLYFSIYPIVYIPIQPLEVYVTSVEAHD